MTISNEYPDVADYGPIRFRSNEMVLTAEFKINLLRPALGDRLRCRATVLKAGRTLIVAESEVYAVRDGKEKLVAKATVTLAPVEKGK